MDVWDGPTYAFAMTEMDWQQSLFFKNIRDATIMHILFIFALIKTFPLIYYMHFEFNDVIVID